MTELELINEKLQELVKVVQNQMAEERRLLAEQSEIAPTQYLDSTGKIIDQPEVLLINKEKPEIVFETVFANGVFQSTHSFAFAMSYELAEKRVLYNPDRGTDCLFKNQLLIE